MLVVLCRRYVGGIGVGCGVAGAHGDRGHRIQFPFALDAAVSFRTTVTSSLLTVPFLKVTLSFPDDKIYTTHVILFSPPKRNLKPTTINHRVVDVFVEGKKPRPLSPVFIEQ